MASIIQGEAEPGSVALEYRIIELEAAIRNHRDQKADDRCWLDDTNLYAVLKDSVAPDNALPPREVFLSNCQRFYDRRCAAGNWPSYQDLEKRIESLEQTISEAWEEAQRFGEVMGIASAHLPALICGATDKALERIEKLEAALRIYADRANWKCPRCSRKDNLNCFMGLWAGPVNEEDGHGYDIAEKASAAL